MVPMIASTLYKTTQRRLTAHATKTPPGLVRNQPARSHQRWSLSGYLVAIRVAIQIAMLIVLLIALPSVTPAAAGRVTDRDGVLYVSNDATPAAGIETLELEEHWRIGGEDDEENFFGIINDVLVDAGGNLYLLDVQLTEVQVYDQDGQYVKTLGHRGDGPGELRAVAGQLLLPDGTLGLYQPFPGQIVSIDLDGIPAGSLKVGGDDPTAGGMVGLRGVASRGDSLVVDGMRMTRGEGFRQTTHFIGTMGLTGGLGTVYLEWTRRQEFRAPTISETAEDFPHGGRWALGPDGRVWVAPQRNEYRIDVYRSDGSLERIVEVPFRSWQRTAAETERARTLLQPRRRGGRGRRPPIEVELAATEPDIVRLQVAANGELWVQTSRSTREQVEGTLLTYDVFDGAGHFVRQVAIVCSGIGTRDALFPAGPDHFVQVIGHSDAFLAWRGSTSENQGEDQGEEMEAIPLEVVYYRKK